MLIPIKRIEENVKEKKDYKEGRYTVRIIDAKEGTSDNSGTPYLEVKFQTVEDEIFEVKKRFYITDKALSILTNFLSSIGLYEKGQTADVEYDVDDLVGNMLSVEFVKGTANSEGKSYLELKAWSCESVVSKSVTKKKKVKEEEIIGEEEIPF